MISFVFGKSREMATQQERAELDAKARQGETVVPGGTGGLSLEAQEHLAEGPLMFSNIRLTFFVDRYFLFC